MNGRGRLGEEAAARYLEGRGYRIICRNYRSRFGEIDIIAENKSFLVFAEVKTRKAGAFVGGAESVDYHKRRRLTLTAERFLLSHQSAPQPRFDVIEVEDSEGGIRVVSHIENAF